MKRFSNKRAKENRKYLKLATAFKEDKECEAGLPGCTGIVTDIHHQRGRIGKNLLDQSTWLPVCRNCHSIIEHEPEMAKENGFSKSRLSVIIAEADKDLNAIIIHNK